MAGPCAGNDEVKWFIPARHLNTLWTDLMPRVAAGVWHSSKPVQWPTNNDCLPDILKWILWALGHATKGSASWHRLKSLELFLSGPAPLPRFIWVGEGEYDFLLSNHGVELFGPPPPPGTGVNDLLRYYRFRRTGRAPIGVPGVGIPAQKDAHLYTHHLISAPTGPSQLKISDGIFDDPAFQWTACGKDAIGLLCQIVSSLLARTEAELLDMSDATLGRIVDLFFRFKTQLTAVDAAITAQIANELNLLGDLAAAARDANPLFDHLENLAAAMNCGSTGLGIFDYLCATMDSRCWWLEGATYRGMLEQFPRVVVEQWLGTSPATLAFADALRERLESSLPPGMDVEFPVPSPPPGSGWDPDEVMITNLGVHFPKIVAPTSFNDMLEEIYKGRAGNPVFTDSFPCN